MNSQKHHNTYTILVLAAVAVLLVTTLAPAWTVQANSLQASSPLKTPVTIYGDSLATSWQDWSWDATRNLSNPSPIQSGSRSISISINKAWGALYLHRSTALSTTGYTHLQFYIHGGTSGTQRIMVSANNNASKRYLASAPLNKWAKVSIPLSSLGSPAALSDLFFQDALGKALPKFYIDTVSLVDLSSPVATATKVITAAPTKTLAPGTLVPTKPAATATRAAATATKAAATATARPTATRTPSTSTRYFTTLPPGSKLPSDAECAAAVKRKPENKRSNATYNATVGNQRLASDFFGGGDPRGNTEIAARVTGNFTGTTDEILQWAACKWGFDEDMVRAQAAIESWWRQDTKGDWTTNSANCAPGHGLGVDGRAGQCPESWGILQNRYPYEKSSWPAILTSTAFNADTAYAEMRNCYEGYEWWLNNAERGSQYGAGDTWGCVGRWFSGRWHTQPAEDYISRVKNYLSTRVWETSSFQEP